MRRPIYFAVGLFVFAAITYCIYMYRRELGFARPATTAASESPGKPDLQPQIPLVEWQAVDRASDGFKLQLPGSPEEARIPAYNERGGVEPVNMLVAAPEPETIFAVAWADHPPVERASIQNAEKALDLARNGALVRTQTILTGESRAVVYGYPARQFSARNDRGGVLTARLVLAGSRLYMLIAAFPSASVRRDADVNRFFGSLELAAAGENH